jgi:hypothetical protein
VERDVQEFRRGFTMLQALGKHAEGKRLDASDGLVAVLTVGHHAGQGGHLGQPATVVFPLDFNRERHEGNVPSGLAANKAMDPTPRGSLPRPARAQVIAMSLMATIYTRS